MSKTLTAIVTDNNNTKIQLISKELDGKFTWAEISGETFEELIEKTCKVYGTVMWEIKDLKDGE